MKRILILVSFLFAAMASYADDGPPFDFRADLGYDHQQVLETPLFTTWSLTHDLARWSESRRDESGRQTILLQDEGPVTAAAILGIEEKLTGDTKSTGMHREFSAQEVKSSYNSAKNAVATKGYHESQFESVIPFLDLRADPPLTWAIRIAGHGQQTFVIAPGAKAKAKTFVPAIPKFDIHACTPGEGDALSENDLHHWCGGRISSVILPMIKGAATTAESAARLCHEVHDDVRYSMFDLADLYTDADTITRSRAFGMCDEKSVVLISYLRTLGIPARLKFLRWMRKGKEQAHACVEYYDKSDAQWHHLDPTWNVIDNRAVYRNTKVDGYKPVMIKVVDVDWPDDARFATPIGGHRDPDGDGRLNPWKDFCYTPDVKGDPDRPGYSN